MSSSKPLLFVWWPTAFEQTQAEEEGRSLRVRYEVHSRLGQKLHGGDELPDHLPKELPATVLMAPGEVGLFIIDKPKVSGKKLTDALPFLVEPFILNEPEENFVHLHEGLLTDKPDQLLASVVEKRRARAILDLCSKSGLQVHHLSCETLRVTTEGEQAAWRSGPLWYVATQGQPTLAASANQASIFKAVLKPHSAVRLAQEQEEDFKALGLNCQTEASSQPVVQPLIELSKAKLLSASDMRRVGYKTRSGDEQWLKRLMWPATVCTIVGIAGLNALALKQQHNLNQIDAQISQTYAQALPNTPMVADPLLLINRAKRQLNSGQQTSDNKSIAFLLHEVGLAMGDAPFNSMTGMAWKDHTLTLRFSATVNKAAQESATRQLASRNLQARWVIGSKSQLPLLQVSVSGDES